MKRLIAALLLFPLFLQSQTVSKKIRVLFIGNSYTHVNNLPLLIANLAAANHDTLVHDNYTPGGYSFSNHFNDPSCLAKIALGNWHFVVLQAQSQEPAFSPSQVNNQTLPYLRKLDSVIKKYNPCATTVLYETWGRKNGDQGNCGFYPPVCTYTGMQNRLRDSYRLFADTVHGVMAPVGEAFRASVSATPTLDLYQFDESHPSFAGSYLAGAVFYETLFQKSVLSNTFNPGINPAHQWFLQQVAHATVHDSLTTWNIGKHHPWADFSFTTTNLSCQFISQSPGYNNTWFFGDSNTSTAVSPAHIYAAAGTYTVSHVTYNACKKDSAARVMTVSNAVGVLSVDENSMLIFYPNPATEVLMFSEPAFRGTGTLQIHDHLGRLVYEGCFKPRIDISALHPGVYRVSYRDHDKNFTQTFVKSGN